MIRGSDTPMHFSTICTFSKNSTASSADLDGRALSCEHMMMAMADENGPPQIGVGDDFEESHARSVQIDQCLERVLVMVRLAAILLELDALEGNSAPPGVVKGEESNLSAHYHRI